MKSGAQSLSARPFQGKRPPHNRPAVEARRREPQISAALHFAGGAFIFRGTTWHTRNQTE
jgi:hypothetical protein